MWNTEIIGKRHQNYMSLKKTTTHLNVENVAETLDHVGKYHIPSLKLTYPLRMDGWKTSFFLGWPIFRCYVSFREGMFFLIFLQLKKNLPRFQVLVHHCKPKACRPAEINGAEVAVAGCS